MIIKVKDCEPFELDEKFYINPDGWFQRCFLIEVKWSNACTYQFIVEADYESEAIDVLLDSKFGYLFKVSKEEIDKLQNEFKNTGKEFDWDNFLDFLSEEKDIHCGGNDGALYHSDMFLCGCINRCKVEGFDYEKEY